MSGESMVLHLLQVYRVGTHSQVPSIESRTKGRVCINWPIVHTALTDRDNTCTRASAPNHTTYITNKPDLIIPARRAALHSRAMNAAARRVEFPVAPRSRRR